MADVITVSTTTTTPTHDIKLTDGTNTLGITLSDGRGKPVNTAIRQSTYPATALKISQGDADYAYEELPYTSWVQRDWSGGRGNRIFEKDTTRYAYSQGIDATTGKVMLAPKSFITSGEQTGTSTIGGLWVQYINAAERYLASKFTLDAARNPFVFRLKFEVPTYPIDTTKITVYVYSDTTGTPNAQVGSWSEAVYVRGRGEYQFETGLSLSAATVYWFVIKYEAGQNSVYTKASPTSTNYCKTSLNGSTWAAFTTSCEFWFAISATVNPDNKVHYFELCGQLYSVSKPGDGTAPVLKMNGYRGMAIANTGALTTLKTTGGHYVASEAEADYVVDELIGCIVKLVGGTGSTEEQPWRAIIDNDEHTMTVSPAWKITHDATTEYVILGTNVWTTIATTGLTKPVTSVAVINGYAYFAQGDLTKMRRMRTYSTGASKWLDAFADDGTNYATYLEIVPITTGTFKIWKANNATSAGVALATVAGATPVTTWTDLTFGTAISCGAQDVRINSIIPYGTPRVLWVLKEDEIGSVSEDNVYAPVPIGELRKARSEYTGRAALHFGIYLYFSFIEGGVERYYEGRLDDVGPNRDEGLPPLERGEIAAMISYPGRFYAACDAGINGISQILCWNGVGWHSIYHAPQGARIQSLFIQPLPGAVSRLWFSQGGNIGWIPIAINPLTQDGSRATSKLLVLFDNSYSQKYYFNTSGEIVSSWMCGSPRERKKFFRELAIYGERLSATVKVTAYYQVDADTTWTLIGTDYTSDGLEVAMGSYNVTGRRFRIKLALSSANTTNDNSTTPIIEASRVNVILRSPPAKSYTLTFVVRDYQSDKQGTRSEVTAATVETLLNQWADSDLYPAPLTMSSNFSIWDSKRVFIDAPTVQPIELTESEGEGRKVVILCSVNVKEV
jgi:hypothetical protein